MELVEKTTTLSSPLIKREISPDVVDLQSHTNTSPSRTGMTPSCLKSYLTWVPFPLIPSVVPENKVSLFNDRQLDPLEWVDLLEQTECLDYISPDIDKCIERQSRMEGNQELELTGREFVDSPVIPRLPYLSGLSSAEQPTLLMPRTRLQGGHASRCSSLRELPSCRKTLTENNDANLKNTYPVIAEQLIQMKRPSRGAKRSTAHSSLRSANRLLDFETSQHSNSRHKRASWGGRPARVANARAASRRECKSARKSKDCMIPGCTKGARSRGLCKRHGGGKRCTYSECSRSDQGGGFCIAHGGGKRCAAGGCKNSAQSRGLCKSHGGGKRCRAKGCTKSSQAGGFCRGHKPKITFL